MKILPIGMCVLAFLCLLPAVSAQQADPNPTATWEPAEGLVLRGTVLTQDPDHTVLIGGAVCIRADRIEAVVPAGQALPAAFADAPVIDTGG